jgi:hypothetical protein
MELLLLSSWIFSQQIRRKFLEHEKEERKAFGEA